MSQDGFTPEFTPVEINYLRDDRVLEVIWDDGATTRLSAELLRVESPSAEVQGHHPSEKKIIPGRRHVGIIDISPVGNYAVRISFDDLHDSGLYSWQYLRELHDKKDTLWADYLAALEARGLSRDP
ncbi:gamma-butyrobetaine hydroxylase-like domain-containing protein [Thalassospira povalilytica]|uniref:gamma-butyrobetaine hydroxylase-like domain-containing protein n=1 Tax=Thalassospira povalilytica TaxID=732237 RepID=UPI003AA7B8E8